MSQANGSSGTARGAIAIEALLRLMRNLLCSTEKEADAIRSKPDSTVD